MAVTTENDPRKNSRGGRAAQLTMSLEAVKDVATREALENVLAFVREMVSGGLKTDGDLTARSLTTDGGGAWRVAVFEGTVIPRDAGLADLKAIKVPGKILGAFGYSQVSGSAKWQIMSYSSSALHLGAYWYLSATTDNNRMLNIRSNDTGNSNQYRAIIFYSGDRA